MTKDSYLGGWISRIIHRAVLSVAGALGDDLVDPPPQFFIRQIFVGKAQFAHVVGVMAKKPNTVKGTRLDPSPHPADDGVSTGELRIPVS